MPLVDVPSEVISETERRARTLEAAALEIEVRGWRQGRLCGADGTVCMAAAVAAAAGTAADDVIAYELLYETWHGRLPNTGSACSDVVEALRLPEWNDTVGRTAEEVTARLRSRAAELRSI